MNGCHRPQGARDTVSRMGALPKALAIVHIQAQGWFLGPQNSFSLVLLHLGTFAIPFQSGMSEKTKS